jgi:hypothetical protein
LIEGEIFDKAPVGSPHAGVVNGLNRIFNRLACDKALVSVQNPLIVGNRSVPQPDLVLLKPRADFYSASHPTADLPHQASKRWRRSRLRRSRSR